MSGNISQMTSPAGGSSGFAMNPTAQADLAGGVAQFNSMVKSGDITNIQSSLQSLQGKVGSDVTGYFGQNNAGLNDASYKTLSGAQYQMSQLAGQLGNGASSLANLSKFGQTFESALSLPPPTLASTAGTAPAAEPYGAAGGEGMSGIAQQLVGLLQQVLQQLGQGSAQSAGQGAPASGGQAAAGGSPAQPDAARSAAGPSAPEGGAQGGPESIISELLKVLEQLVQQLGHGSAQGAGGQPPAQQGGEEDELASLKEALGPLIQKLAGHAGGGAAPAGGTQPSTTAATPPGDAGASGGPFAAQPASGASASTGGGHQAEMMQMMSQLLQIIMQMMQSMNGSGGGGAGGMEA